VAVVAGVARHLAMLAPAANQKRRLFRQTQTNILLSYEGKHKNKRK
jgi:hypothetical protein